jgi:hypothetical protein
MKTAGTGGVGSLELEVAASLARARENGNALGELGELLTRYPVLKVDVPDQQWNQKEACWEGRSHLLSPLAVLYAEQLFTD